MALTPRLSLDEEFIGGMKCAICESAELKIVHVDKYPDFVSCGQCGSAFVVEKEGSWVMFGKISQEYPETSQFALKQWTWLDAVTQRAEDERTERSGPPATSDPTPEASESIPPLVDAIPPKPEESTPPVAERIPSEPKESIPSGLEETPSEPTGSTPPVIEDIPLESIDSTPPVAEDSRLDVTENPPPFLEEQSSPTMEDLFPEDPIQAIDEPGEEFSQMPPFPEEVIILGDESSEFSTFEDFTPSFMEPGPGPEEVIVPTPFEPIEPEVIEIGEPESMPVEDVSLDKEKTIEDITEQIAAEIPDVPKVHPAEIPEHPSSTPAKLETELVEESPQPDDELKVSSPLEEEDKSLSVPVGEPEPDKRYQITLRGSQPKYPKNYCAHCLRTPVKLKTIMRGSLPDPKNPGQRKLVPLELPFCKDCQKRMDARSQGENNARMIAFLVSAVVAVIAIVVPLVFGFLDFESNAFLSITLLLVFGVLGFSIPLLVWFFLANNYPPPRDAALVLSTLLVLESGSDTTLFEWRNHGYAELFRQVNIENVQGNLELVEDRTTFTEVQPEVPPEEPSEEPEQPIDEENLEEEIPSS